MLSDDTLSTRKYMQQIRERAEPYQNVGLKDNYYYLQIYDTWGENIEQEWRSQQLLDESLKTLLR